MPCIPRRAKERGWRARLWASRGWRCGTIRRRPAAQREDPRATLSSGGSRCAAQQMNYMVLVTNSFPDRAELQGGASRCDLLTHHSELPEMCFCGRRLLCILPSGVRNGLTVPVGGRDTARGRGRSDTDRVGRDHVGRDDATLRGSGTAAA